jgi:hypothetical protein
VRNSFLRIFGAVALAALCSSDARALTLASNVIALTTPYGTASFASQVDDNVGGDTSRWLFSYTLTGTYDPLPGQSNGLSALVLYFGGPVSDVADQTGPAGWLQNELADLPFGVSFEILNSTGYGAGPNGGASFSFAVPAGTPYTDEPLGSLLASHVSDVPFGGITLEELIIRGDTVIQFGPIVPVPEPGSLVLIAGGLALLARRRVSSAA